MKTWTRPIEETVASSTQRPSCCFTVSDAIEQLRRQSGCGLITNQRRSVSGSGRLRDLDPTLPVVVMTAWGSVEGAVEAMRRGARDYVQKPWDNARLLATLRAQVELGRALRRTRR
jgi:FixJ family two-component response regulator